MPDDPKTTDEARLMEIRRALGEAAARGLVHPYDYHDHMASFLLRLLDEARSKIPPYPLTSGVKSWSDAGA